MPISSIHKYKFYYSVQQLNSRNSRKIPKLSKHQMDPFSPTMDFAIHGHDNHNNQDDDRNGGGGGDDLGLGGFDAMDDMMSMVNHHDATSQRSPSSSSSSTSTSSLLSNNSNSSNTSNSNASPVNPSNQNIQNSLVVQNRLVRLTQRWTINHFNYYLEEPRETDEDEELLSPKFSATTAKGHKLTCCLRLFPQGNKPDNQNYCSLFLRVLTCKKGGMRLKFRLSILDQHQVEHLNYETSHKFVLPATYDDWGWSRFISHEELKNPANGYLHDNRLTVLCVVEALDETLQASATLTPMSMMMSSNSDHQESSSSVISAIATDSIDSSLPSQPNMSSTNNYRCAAQMMLNYGKFFETGELTDVVLVTGQGTKEHHAHRAFLAAQSPVFAAMFRHDNNTAERQSGRVLVEDIEPEVMEGMLRFIYTGRIESDALAMADRLFIVADKYQIAHLKEACEQAIMAQLSPSNVTQVLQLAERLQARQLRACALEFIACHMHSVIGAPLSSGD